MIKKLEIALGIVFFILCIAIVITIKNKKSDYILPQDTVESFFQEMMDGNFRVAMTTYLDDCKENQVASLEENIDLYKMHWQNVGVDINEETINKKEGTATCNVYVYKYNIEEILGDIRVRLLNVNTLKSDGTYITEKELNELKKQYIKEAYTKNINKYGHIINVYDLKLVWDEEYETWYIVNNDSITDILFGNVSNIEE